jgi:predicted ATPase
MIIAALLDVLFERGVTLVATPVLALADLYRSGLPHAHCMPGIA